MQYASLVQLVRPPKIAPTGESFFDEVFSLSPLEYEDPGTPNLYISLFVNFTDTSITSYYEASDDNAQYWTFNDTSLQMSNVACPLLNIVSKKKLGSTNVPFQYRASLPSSLIQHLANERRSWYLCKRKGQYYLSTY